MPNDAGRSHSADGSPTVWSDFAYAVVRVVPRVERQEFVNCGVILLSRERRFLGARIELDVERLRYLAGTIDPAPIARHLETFLAVAEGRPNGRPVAALPEPERFHWLTAPRSTVIQTSPVHTGICSDPQACLDALFARLVGAPTPTSAPPASEWVENDRST